MVSVQYGGTPCRSAPPGLWIRSSSTGSSSGAIPSQKRGLNGPTSRRAVSIAARGSEGSTGSFGRLRTGRSPMVTTSTIGTAIRSTTTSAISSASPKKSTMPPTPSPADPKNGSDGATRLTRSGTWLRPGIEPTKVVLGTSSTVSKPMLNGSPGALSVSVAAPPSNRPSAAWSGSVGWPARQRLDEQRAWTTWFGPVSDAGSSSALIGTARSATVPAFVLNGVGAKPSDALRYAVAHIDGLGCYSAGAF